MRSTQTSGSSSEVAGTSRLSRPEPASPSRGILRRRSASQSTISSIPIEFAPSVARLSCISSTSSGAQAAAYGSSTDVDLASLLSKLLERVFPHTSTARGLFRDRGGDPLLLSALGAACPTLGRNF